MKFELANTSIEPVLHRGERVENQFLVHTTIRLTRDDTRLLERIPGVSMIERTGPYCVRVSKGHLFSQDKIATLVRAAIEKRRRKR